MRLFLIQNKKRAFVSSRFVRIFDSRTKRNPANGGAAYLSLTMQGSGLRLRFAFPKPGGLSPHTYA